MRDLGDHTLHTSDLDEQLRDSAKWMAAAEAGADGLCAKSQDA
jgi:ATP-dependent protease ClpP protease subunit